MFLGMCNDYILYLHQTFYTERCPPKIQFMVLSIFVFSSFYFLNNLF